MLPWVWTSYVLHLLYAHILWTISASYLFSWCVLFLAITWVWLPREG